ncbi:unnamed protein product [Bemisia tabaci]|uniref:Ionotropic receptor n=1 Tax=Bemisia tabaci TaxID=7038 RepID=A0A9P0F403_BEMTA|nr:unnamed protein product [Bemisia tabaci]
MTRGLYTNPIRNSNNYLIFMLRDFDRDDCKPPKQHHAMISPNETASNDFDGLIFCFKFIWRFFRGLRTTICSEKGCSRYDHFAENIIWYSGEDHEVYFDFSVTNMHRKHLSFLLDDAEGVFVTDHHFQKWMSTVRAQIIDAVAESINCTNTFYIGYGYDDEEIGHEVGQQLNVDLHHVDIGATTEEIDYSRFDFSVGVETEAMCILTPHSELLPQCLVPFKVFSFPVWIFIGITVIVFVLMQYVFLQAQGGSFRNLYSETDISLYDSTSAAHTMYAYFICGSPPRLLLGKLFTGKILFIIFIFSALIISSVFLGGMTTLLTNTVQYPEIDTLKDLEDSDLLIQVPDTEAAALYFAQLGLSEKLRGKLACNLALYLRLFDEEIGQSIRPKTPIGFQYRLWRDYVPEKFVKNVHVIMENDAFVAALQASLSSGTRVVRRLWLFPEKFEYHLVSERLKVRPYFHAFLKNSFLFEKFNVKMAQFLESGHVSKAYDSDFLDAPEAAPPPPKEEDPRPYSLNDLQLPFFSLLLGLFSSLLVFIAEMVIEDFESVFVFRQLSRFKNFLTKKND